MAAVDSTAVLRDFPRLHTRVLPTSIGHVGFQTPTWTRPNDLEDERALAVYVRALRLAMDQP